MVSFNTLLFSIDNGLASITLNRPEAANSLDMDMAKELLQVSIICRSESGVRAVLLTGNGKLFCAGGDLNGFVTHRKTLRGNIKELTTYLHAAVANFARMRAPLVVAVNGAAAGAGFSLALCGDVVLAGKSARFTMAYTAAGLVPDGGSSYVLPRVVGLRRAQELMLTNRRLSADEARDWGIVTRVVEDAELMAEAGKSARLLAAGPTHAFGLVKRLLLTSFDNTLETQMEEESAAIADSACRPDGYEGVDAFFEKRPARFKGD
jgi:2-(1,2-epoxy-1,2-dihydrophenyl)acetyl-CoA isomerase